MYIAGIGSVCNRGRGIDAVRTALTEGWQEPAMSDQGVPVYRISQELLSDKEVLRGARRADRFSKMALLAAHDAIVDSGIATAELGVIIATGFGPHATTFRFLDDIIAYGDAGVSPTTFSHSVHNAAASYVASYFGAHGPTATVTQFHRSFSQALVIADVWLSEGRCDHVLVGAIDECSQPMEYIARRKVSCPEDGKIRSFDGADSPAAVPGEGSVFFVVTHDAAQKKYCSLTHSFDPANATRGKADITLLCADGFAGDEQGYVTALDKGILVGGYAALFGSMMIGDAFHCASAAIMIKDQMNFASPVFSNPHNLNVCMQTEKIKMSRIECVRISAGNRDSRILLSD